jgi:hypothetical protein
MGGAASPGAFVAGRYRLESLLGEGGFGAVHRATDVTTGGAVALKVLVADAVDMGERFRREAELAMRLSHPNTVRTLDAGEDERLGPYIAMELLEGQSLEAMLRTQGALAPRRAAEIAIAVLSSLEEAHALGIIHRDIKPGNVFLVRAPAPRVKVLDFGIAKSTNTGTRAGLTREGQTVGTPAYMAPEQVSGSPLGPETDLYAVGLVIAESLAGRPVYDGLEPMTVLIDKLEGKPVPIPEAVRGTPLERVVERAVAHAREERFPSAAAMRHAVEQALAAMPDETYGPGALRALPPPPSASGWDAEHSGSAAGMGAVQIPAPAGSQPGAATMPAAEPRPSATDATAAAIVVPVAPTPWAQAASNAPGWPQPSWPGQEVIAPPPQTQRMDRGEGRSIGSCLGGCAIAAAAVLLLGGAGIAALAWALGFDRYLQTPATSRPPPAPATRAAPVLEPAQAVPPGGTPVAPEPQPQTLRSSRQVSCPRLLSLDPRSIVSRINGAGYAVGNSNTTINPPEHLEVNTVQRGDDEVGAVVYYSGAQIETWLEETREDASGELVHARAGNRLLVVWLESGDPMVLMTRLCGATTRGGAP